MYVSSMTNNQKNAPNSCGSSQDEFDTEQLRTFNFMALRKLKRKYQGVYKKRNRWTHAFAFLLVAYSMGLWGFSSSRGVDMKVDILAKAAIQTLVLTLVFVKLMMYWLILGGILAYTITGRPIGLFTPLMDPETEAPVITVQYLTVLAEFLTVFGYLEPIWWWNIKPFNQGSKFGFSYKTRAWMGRKARRYAVYTGELNEAHQPHGYGKWIDTSYNGEHLEGWWEYGIPVGPFTSREGGSGFMFRNIRIAVCSDRSEKGWGKLDYFPRHSELSLRWGVASIECSVSGAFFKFLPNVQDVTNDSDLNSVSDCMPYLKRPSVVSSSDTPSISKEVNEYIGESPNRNSRNVSQNMYPNYEEIIFQDESPNAVSHVSTCQKTKEAVVFIHGFNCSSKYAMKMLSLLLCLGNLPQDMYPFVFSWPSGRIPTYSLALQIAESERTRDDFLYFLNSLMNAGFGKVNILAHSMGARIMMKAIPELSRIFVKTNETSGTLKKKMILSSVVLLNPDCSLSKFVSFKGDFDVLQQYCSRIVLYGDRKDYALLWLEFLFRVINFGKIYKCLGRQVRSISRVLNVDDDDDDDLQVLLGYQMTNNQQYLDMDVIDTTWVDNNVSSTRHNFFNINPSLIQDLFEVLVNKTRASQRNHLMRTSGNVFIFTVAPSHITSRVV